MTSYLFPDGRFSLERLRAVSSAVGKERLVVDVRYVLVISVDYIIETFSSFQLSEKGRSMARRYEQMAGYH